MCKKYNYKINRKLLILLQNTPLFWNMPCIELFKFYNQRKCHTIHTHTTFLLTM